MSEDEAKKLARARIEADLEKAILHIRNVLKEPWLYETPEKPRMLNEDGTFNNAYIYSLYPETM